MLVLTVGQGVVMFTYDPQSGLYLLTEDQVRIAEEAKEFAINMSNQRHWHPAMQRYIGELLQGAEGPRGRSELPPVKPRSSSRRRRRRGSPSPS